MPRTSMIHRVIGSALLVTLISALPCGAAVTYRTLALSGDPAPDSPAGVTYHTVHGGSIYNSGLIRLSASRAGLGVDSPWLTDVWTIDAGLATLVAQAGNPVPGADSGVVFFSTAGTHFTQPDRFLLRGTLTGPGIDTSNDFGYWQVDRGVPHLIAREGDILPGGDPARRFRALASLAQNPAGQTIFRDARSSTGLSHGILEDRLWFYEDGDLTLVVEKNDQAPGMPDGKRFYSFGHYVINAQGRIAFSAQLGHSVSTGLWTGTPGSLELITIQDAPAPTMRSGVLFGGLLSPMLDADGHTTFWARLKGPGIDASNNDGFWSNRSGTLQPILREGDPAPGMAPGVVFGRVSGNLINLHNVSLDPHGRFVFTAHVTGPGIDASNDLGLWIERESGFELLAQEGDRAPNTGPGQVFANIEPPVFNMSGQALFHARLEGPGVDYTNEFGYWAIDRDGSIKRIVRRGALFDVNDDPLIDDFRVIEYIRLNYATGGDHGQETGLTDDGRFVVGLTFTDGTSGAFLFTIPEPASALLPAVGVLCHVRPRRPAD